MTHRRDVIDQLDALKNLDRRDWDSYDAEPISPVAIGYARAFVYAVKYHTGSQTEPVAGPAPDGGVSLVYRGKGDWKVQVLLPPVQPTSPRFVVSESGHLRAKGEVTDVGDFARTVLKQNMAA